MDENGVNKRGEGPPPNLDYLKRGGGEWREGCLTGIPYHEPLPEPESGVPEPHLQGKLGRTLAGLPDPLVVRHLVSRTAGFRTPPPDPRLEEILNGMKSTVVTVGDVDYADPVAYATVRGIPLAVLQRAIEYGTVKHGRAIVRRLATDEICNLVSSGVPEEVARRAVTYKLIRKVKLNTSNLLALRRLYESVGDK